jgi:outer membrane protein assembly complex protein YaeT
MPLALLAAAWLLAAAAPLPAQQPAGPTTVVDIRIEGNKQLSTDAVMRYIRTRIGEDYDAAVVRADEQRLIQSGRFENVATRLVRDERGVTIVFDVAERPLVADVAIAGNQQFTDTEIRKQLALSAGDPLDPYKVEAGRTAIVAMYAEKGYHKVQVTVDQQALAQRQVKYTIVEGPQTRISRLRFSGNQNYSWLTLNSKVESSQRFWPFINGFFDPKTVDEDVQSLKSFYVSEGYLDADVSRDLQFSADGRKVTLTFNIKEGPRFRINSLRFVGSTIYDDKSLAQGLLLQPGEHYTSLKLQRDAKALRGKYGEIGFIDADVEVRREFLAPDAPVPPWAQRLDSGAPALLNLVFTITENDQYSVGRVDIRGNSITQDRVIRRELRIYPEQLFDTVAVEESRKRLMESRLFNNVTISPVGQQAGVRDALVQVEEGFTADFIVGVGVSSDAGVLGNITFTERNFDIFNWPGSWSDISSRRAWRGAGQVFRISLEPGTELNRFTIEWYEPYLGQTENSLGMKAYLFSRERETYDEQRAGALASFGRRFKNRWYGELSPKIEDVNITDLQHDAPPEVRQVEGDNLMLSLKGTLVRDNTDSRWLPSTGDRLRLAYEQFFGDFTFGRATGEYQKFWTTYVDALDRKHILAARVSAGQIFGDAPVFEEFYGGGINSIRGFKYRGISPRSRGTDEPIGGDFMFFAGTEYSVPIVGENLRGVVFVDSGTVERDSEFTSYRVSTGVGIRWVIPMMGPVPLSLDFGFPIVKADEDDTQIFSFSLGWQF